MARIPTNRSNIDWAANLAVVSLAGIRIFRQANVSVPASSSASYTVQDSDTRRLIVFHAAPTNVDIRVALNATATSTSFPVATGVYFALEVEVGDSVSFFNTSGSSLTVYLVEVG